MVGQLAACCNWLSPHGSRGLAVRPMNLGLRNQPDCGLAGKPPCVFRVQRGSRTDRSPAWRGIDSTDSPEARLPLTGLQRINIRWTGQGLRFRDQREGVAQQFLDRWSRSTVCFSPFAIPRPTPPVSEQQRQFASVVPQSDHDPRGDSATEYQRSCSKLAESGSITLTTHSCQSRQQCWALSRLVVRRSVQGSHSASSGDRR